jgi:DNA-binding SARP family transcriptional activator
MFRLEVFGGLVLVDEAGAEVATQPRRLALLALLATAGARGLTRAKLQAYLWPESSADGARHALEQLLYYLRRQVDPNLFLGPDPLRLNPVVITSDLGEFEQALASGALADAAERFRGPFLDGFDLGDAPEFEPWLETERSRLQRAYRQALFRLAEQEDQHGRHAAAIDWWGKLVATDPLSARGALGLMRALVAAGDRPEAVKYARSYEALVREELGDPLAPEVGTYLAQLRATTTAHQHVPPAGWLPEAPRFTPTLSEVGQGHESGMGRDEGTLVTPGQPNQGGTRASRRLLALGLVAGILVTVGTFATLGLRRAGTVSLDRNLVAIAPFDVLGSGLDLWREGLVDVLSRSLDGAGNLRTVAPSVVIRRWNGRADAPSATELGHRTGAGLILFGSVLSSGSDSVRFSATLFDLTTGQPVAEIEARDATDRIDRLADSLAVRLLWELGRTRAIGAVRLSSVGTTSFAALKAFLRGEQFFRQTRWDSAQAHYERAIALDSTFVAALRHLSMVIRWQSPVVGSSYEIRASELAFRAAGLNRGLGLRDSLLVAADSLSGACCSSPGAPEHRVLATLQEAARRFPEDPEVWYALGEVLFHRGRWLGVTPEQQFEAFKKALALDSGFALAYPHAISLGLETGGLTVSRRYGAAYLALEPAGPLAVAVRVFMRLSEPGGISMAELRRLADTLSANSDASVTTALEPLQRWADSTEKELALVRAYADARYRRSGSLEWNSSLSSWLISRGHFREAFRLPGPGIYWFDELALMDAVPADSAEQVFGAWRREGHRNFSYALAWWARRRDTLALGSFVRRPGSVPAGSEEPTGTWPWMAEAAAAYHALARGDSAEALTRFLALPDSGCYCRFHRLVRARLLAEAGRNREAMALLDRVYGQEQAPPMPSEVLWVRERARVAERLKDFEKARRDYGWVARIWRHADPELQSYVAEARAGLARLEGERIK